MKWVLTFIDKIRTIHTKLDKLTSALSEVSESCCGALMDHFKPLSEGDVRKLIEGFPTSLVINCVDVLLPVITKIINLSLESGSFASNWKCTLVNPLLKKTGLDLVFKNYRPDIIT